MVNLDSVVPSVKEMPAKRLNTGLVFTKFVVFKNKKPVIITAIPANKEICASFDFLFEDSMAINIQEINKPPIVPSIAPLVAVW